LILRYENQIQHIDRYRHEKQTKRRRKAQILLQQLQNQTLLNLTNFILQNEYRKRNKIRFFPHVIKIDTEGHDFEILSQYLKDISEHSTEIPLPLLIQFESKLIRPYDLKRLDEQLVKLEYESTLIHRPGVNEGSDSVAILTKQAIYQSYLIPS
jgi:hypothetical protein